MIAYTALCKTAFKVFSHIIFYAHRSKHDRKWFILIFAIPKTCLFYDLCSKFIMRQTVSRKDRQLLSTDQSCKTIDCRDTSPDVVSRILPTARVHRLSVDIAHDFGMHCTEPIDRLP